MTTGDSGDSIVSTRKLYLLINPSDPYTFYAQSIEVAGACAAMLSSSYGAHEVGGKSTPIGFGWSEWLESRGIDRQWIISHASEIAEAYDSFLIGDAATRTDMEYLIEMLPEDKRQAWRDQRQARLRSSLSPVGEAAYAKAKVFFEYVDKQKVEEGVFGSKQQRPTPLPCPFCGAAPELFPKNPKEDGNAWAQVACVNSECAVRPNCPDGESVAGKGIDYFRSAIIRWNKRT